MWRALASLAILLVAGLAILDARCVADCAAIAQLPPCHRHQSGHQPKCALLMTSVRPVSIDVAAPVIASAGAPPVMPCMAAPESLVPEVASAAGPAVFHLRI